jgi:hypothetical protein
MRSKIVEMLGCVYGKLRKVSVLCTPQTSRQEFRWPITGELNETQNNESRSQLSTRSTVIGKAKVMSYDDIVEAQSKRDAKEAGIGDRTSTKLQAC